LRPELPKSVAKGPTIDGSLSAIAAHWRIVVAEMAEVYGVDLYDPAILARPWPGVRTMIFALLERPHGHLRAALTRR